VIVSEEFSHAKAQRRKAFGFFASSLRLCAFAPLREKFFL
jgi:hypothetical protein